ncbi:MAG: dipeptidyl-peptidase 3 family protein [Bacteroidales bacterium]
MQKEKGKFRVLTEQFADIRILRYQVPGFDDLPAEHKKLLYYLYEAALSGRDIIYDQNYKYNLLIRRTLENIVKTFRGDRKTPKWEAFMTYVKRVWFSNGIHHHYSMDKFIPETDYEYFRMIAHNSDISGFPVGEGNLEALLAKLEPLMFDPETDAKRVVQDEDKDMVEASANNFYENVTQKEVEEFYNKLSDPSDPRPVSWGLNSKLVKENGRIQEKVWKWNGMYSQAIEKVMFWLEEALTVATTDAQRQALEKLLEFYKTGELKKFDEYSILWLSDTESPIDVINGFIETYGDPLGRKATFESVVYMRDEEATRRAKTISDHAQWFEDHSPTDKKFKKEKVTGVTARGINVVVESGDCSPSTPIGINLPNADWIRAAYGSKSVTINNIMQAYDEASKESGAIEEFAWSDEEVALSRKYGMLATNLHVDLHEIVGHGSGKLLPGVGNPSDTLKNYAATIEEARADLFALYYAIDDKLIELGLMPERAVGIAEYNGYIRGGLLTQLVRVEPGKNLEESHMRNRQLIAAWAYHHGKTRQVIEKRVRDAKTYFVVNDHDKLRELFGELLKEIQRIKSEGDFDAAKKLVETYGVKVDREIHEEVLGRWKKLKIAPFAGFINPRLIPVFNANGEMQDVKIEYPDDFAMQMLEYGDKYSYLPEYNK